jgi:hypothetical protein
MMCSFPFRYVASSAVYKARERVHEMQTYFEEIFVEIEWHEIGDLSGNNITKK